MHYGYNRMRSRAGFGSLCWGRTTRRALRTVQDGHAETVPVPGTLSFFLLVFLVMVAAVVSAAMAVLVLDGDMSVLIVVAMLAVLIVLAVLLSLALLLILAVLAILAELFRRQRLFLLTVFSALPGLSLAPVFVMVNGPSRPNPSPRETVTISLCSGSGTMLRASPLGVCACDLHRAGPRGWTGLGLLTTQTSGSSLPGPPPLLLLLPASSRLFERESPYSVKLPLSLRRSSGWDLAKAAFTRVAHSLRYSDTSWSHSVDLPLVFSSCSLCSLYSS